MGLENMIKKKKHTQKNGIQYKVKHWDMLMFSITGETRDIFLLKFKNLNSV